MIPVCGGVRHFADTQSPLLSDPLLNLQETVEYPHLETNAQIRASLSIGIVWRAMAVGQAESQRCITNEESKNFADLNF